MRIALTVIIILLSLPATAQLRTQPVMSLSYLTHLELAKAAEVETIHKMGERLRAGDRSLCRYDHRISLSMCALQMIRSYRVHSSVALRTLLDLSVLLAVIDRANGVAETQLNRDLAENFLAVAETARPEKFFAAQMSAKTKRDRLQKTQARIAENAALESFRTFVLPLIGTQIAKGEAWPLRARAEKLRARPWAVK